MRKVWDERHKYFRILAVHYLRVEIHASLGAFPGSLSPQGPDLQWSMVRFSYEITATLKNERTWHKEKASACLQEFFSCSCLTTCYLALLGTCLTKSAHLFGALCTFLSSFRLSHKSLLDEFEIIIICSISLKVLALLLRLSISNYWTRLKL